VSALPTRDDGRLGEAERNNGRLGEVDPLGLSREAATRRRSRRVVFRGEVFRGRLREVQRDVDSSGDRGLVA